MFFYLFFNIYFNKLNVIVGEVMNRNPLSKLMKIIIIGISLLIILRYLIINSSVYFRDYRELPFTVHLNKDNIVMQKGDTFQLRINGINKRVKYSTTDFRIAWASPLGKIHALQTGKAYIKADVDNKTIKCRVRVIDINKDKLTLKVGESNRLGVKGMIRFPRWKSSNPKVASVNRFGKVVGKSKGKVTISGKVKNTKLKCQVIVQ